MGEAQESESDWTKLSPLLRHSYEDNVFLKTTVNVGPQAVGSPRTVAN